MSVLADERSVATNIAPKSIVVEVADPIPQRGRRNPRMRHGECNGVLPGFVPLACSRRVSCEQGRSCATSAKGGREIRRSCVSTEQMRVDPSEPACRRRLQTASGCYGRKVHGGERWGKGMARLCQVWAKKVSVKRTNASVEKVL